MAGAPVGGSPIIERGGTQAAHGVVRFPTQEVAFMAVGEPDYAWSSWSRNSWTFAASGTWGAVAS